MFKRRDRAQSPVHRWAAAVRAILVTLKAANGRHATAERAELLVQALGDDKA